MDGLGEGGGVWGSAEPATVVARSGTPLRSVVHTHASAVLPRVVPASGVLAKPGYLQICAAGKFTSDVCGPLESECAAALKVLCGLCKVRVCPWPVVARAWGGSDTPLRASLALTTWTSSCPLQGEDCSSGCFHKAACSKVGMCPSPGKC